MIPRRQSKHDPFFSACAPLVGPALFRSGTGSRVSSYPRSSSLPVKLLVFSSPGALPSKDRVDADAGEGMCQEPSGQQSAGSARLSSAVLSRGRDQARVVLLCWVAGDGRGRGDDAADLKGRGGRILHTHPCIPAAH